MDANPTKMNGVNLPGNLITEMYMDVNRDHESAEVLQRHRQGDGVEWVRDEDGNIVSEGGAQTI